MKRPKRRWIATHRKRAAEPHPALKYHREVVSADVLKQHFPQRPITPDEVEALRDDIEREFGVRIESTRTDWTGS